MNSFYSAKCENNFYYMLTIQLLMKYQKNFLTVVHIVIHNGGNNGEIQRSLKHCTQNFKNLSEKHKNITSTCSIKQI